MTRIHALSLLSLIAILTAGSLGAQESSSEEVERQDDAFRRQMELEDARNRNKAFADTTYEDRAEQEKIDKLPQASRENIREQLVDVIVENGEWEPKDALAEYPYEPTEAAQKDGELMKQEQEAWDEQIQKYHEREAAAFGSHRGPVPGPGNPTGEEGRSTGSQGQQGSSGNPGQSSSNPQQGTYQPYRAESPSDSDEISTAGVSESALDFLRHQGSAPPQTTAEAAPPPDLPETTDPAQDLRGIIAISELDKLEGATGSSIVLPVEADEPPEDEDP